MPPIGLATSRSTPTSETSIPKLWLLLVGVNQYQDKRLPSLRYSSVDCQGLADALVEATQEFAQKQVNIHHDFAPQPPKLDTLRASLKQIYTAAKPQDTVLIYFSGHGMLEPNTEQAVLCLADTQKNNLLETGLKVQELLQLLGTCAAHQQLVWLDACHSGGMTLRGAIQDTKVEPLLNPTPQLVEVLQQRAAKSKGFYALLSCDRGQQSWEFPELGHGVFTYYLMRGLRGEAADSQGVIDADGLYRYVYHQTLQYIDKTNQQLRLINQQKRHRGEVGLYSEYPLQTPKRIVEGVGEVILGSRQFGMRSRNSRTALVVEGLTSSEVTLSFSKVLRGAGSFELEYWPQPGKTSARDIREAIQKILRSEPVSQGELPNLEQWYEVEEPATVLLYLRGRLEETESADTVLLLGEDIALSRSWLRQQLRHSQVAQQIVILDCPVGREQDVSLQDWLEDLQLDPDRGQCIIAAASLDDNPEQFAQTLLDTLVAAQQPAGLSVAGWITQLQVSLAGAFPLHIWLSGARGVMEVLPGKTGSQSSEQSEGLDLGLCPYRGLRPFGEDDSQYFYGRETLTQQLISHLAHQSFLAVVGASGSGKSSVVQAGLMAQLRRGKQLPGSEKWWIRKLTPGTRPLEALSRRLGEESRGRKVAQGVGGNVFTDISPDKSSPAPLVLEGMLYQGVEGFVYWIRSRPEPMVVLVVDQFEELFTLAPTEDRQRFLELLLGAVEYAPDKFKLIVTLRADFIASCLEIPALATLLQQSNVLVPPRLTSDDYRRVIVNPAEQVGLKVAPNLVEVLLKELNCSVGDLPLLEFVLEQLWEYRSSGELTLQAYQQQVGGIQGALERKAQAAYESLDPQAKECARWIFLSLTQLGEGTEDTRRRVFKSDLVVKKYPAELVDRTLSALTAAKLVVMNLEEDEEVAGSSRGTPATSPEPEELSLELMQQQVTVEVAHEVLIRHWSTLRWWLEENRSRLRSQRQIEQAALLWKHSGELSDFLLHGVRLAEAEDIYIKYTDELSDDVQRFIAACLEERQRQQFEAKKRLRQAQRAVVVISVLGLAALGFGGLAYWKSQAAQLREIDALNSSSKANLLSNQQLEALIASVKAGKQLKSTIAVPTNVQLATVSTLQQVVSGMQERNRLEGHSAAVTSVSFSPDGKAIASASDDATIKLWRRDGTLLKTLKGHNSAVRSVGFTPQGNLLASASFDKTVKLWRISDGIVLKTFQGHKAEVLSVSFNPQGTLLASASADKTIKLWRISDGRLLRTFQGHGAFVNSVSFSPDGQLLASVSADKTIKLWKISDGRLLRTLQGHSAELFSVAFSPDAQTLASASADKTVKLWRISDGTLLQTIGAHNAEVKSVSFSPDGQTLASASNDSTIKLWNPKDGTLLQTFQGHSVGVYSVRFSPDSQTLVSASADKTVRLWQRDDALLRTLQGHQAEVYGVSFNPQGTILASGSEDTTLKLWRTNDGSLRQTLQGYSTSIYGHSAGVYGVSFSPDGQTLASASGDYYIKLWQVRDGELIKTLQRHDGDVNSVSFRPQGDFLATASADRTIKLWRLSNRTLFKTLHGHSNEVLSVSFSPQGTILASASRDNTVKLWRASDGELLQTLQGHSNAVNAVSFNPQGTILASASSDKTIKLWRISDRTTGRFETRPYKTFEGHGDSVWGVSFNPDGKMLASASGDRTVKLWSSDGRELKTFRGHSDAVLNVTFSPDSKTIASASKDGTVKVWHLNRTQLQTLDLDHLLVRSCEWLHDYLKTNPKISNQERHYLCSGLEG